MMKWSRFANESERNACPLGVGPLLTNCELQSIVRIACKAGHDELPAAISRYAKFLFFVTPRSVLSRRCRDEVQYAINYAKPIVVVYLEDAELPPGLELVLGALQAVHRGNRPSPRYLELLLETIGREFDETEIAKGSLSHGPAVLPKQYPVGVG